MVLVPKSQAPDCKGHQCLGDAVNEIRSVKNDKFM